MKKLARRGALPGGAALFLLAGILGGLGAHRAFAALAGLAGAVTVSGLWLSLRSLERAARAQRKAARDVETWLGTAGGSRSEASRALAGIQDSLRDLPLVTQRVVLLGDNVRALEHELRSGRGLPDETAAPADPTTHA